jgi:hypothetical protein
VSGHGFSRAAKPPFTFVIPRGLWPSRNPLFGPLCPERRSELNGTAYQLALSRVFGDYNPENMNIKHIVKNNTVRFSFYRAGYMYYQVAVDGQLYRFPVSLEDLGTATLLAEHKAITLMRYIRKALQDHTFVKA